MRYIDMVNKSKQFYKEFIEILQGKSYKECERLFNVILKKEDGIEINFKSLIITLKNDNGKPIVDDYIESWFGEYDNLNFSKIELI